MIYDREVDYDADNTDALTEEQEMLEYAKKMDFDGVPG
jgi:hypothetical protein